MRSYLDCIPCFLRQALDSARMATDDKAIQEQVLREVLRGARDMDFRKSPPEMGQRIHRLVRRITGDDDPYRTTREHSNRVAQAFYPMLKGTIDQSSHPLETAIRLAIAGNVIDFGAECEVSVSHVRNAITHAMTAPLSPDEVDDFREAVNRSEDILYLGDNAGEIIFDRLLIEQMPREKVTVVVRGGPVINDAIMDDARLAGLVELVDVIDNGSDAPGTILEDCSEGFRKRFNEAELVIAKGQGNYETLSEVEKDIFFMLKVKCPVIARDIGREVGALVLRRRGPFAVVGEGGSELAGI